jgi:hypothetical protein
VLDGANVVEGDPEHLVHAHRGLAAHLFRGRARHLGLADARHAANRHQPVGAELRKNLGHLARAIDPVVRARRDAHDAIACDGALRQRSDHDSAGALEAHAAAVPRPCVVREGGPRRIFLTYGLASARDRALEVVGGHARQRVEDQLGGARGPARPHRAVRCEDGRQIAALRVQESFGDRAQVLVLAGRVAGPQQCDLRIGGSQRGSDRGRRHHTGHTARRFQGEAAATLRAVSDDRHDRDRAASRERILELLEPDPRQGCLDVEPGSFARARQECPVVLEHAVVDARSNV